ncbi:MAG: hypothetical protein LBQ37_02650 [Elusimicrobiota bacterium]|jgi:hypothetical protein|nr:hypothetical protein [Elusimicrobiota bacterium]
MENLQDKNITIEPKLYEALYSFDFNIRELRVILYLLGCGAYKNDFHLRQSDISNELKMNKSMISRTIKSLKNREIIVCKNGVFSVNSFEQWKQNYQIGGSEKLPKQQQKLPKQQQKVVKIATKVAETATKVAKSATFDEIESCQNSNKSCQISNFFLKEKKSLNNPLKEKVTTKTTTKTKTKTTTKTKDSFAIPQNSFLENGNESGLVKADVNNKPLTTQAEAWEYFRERYEKATGLKLNSVKADFVNLTRLVKQNGIEDVKKRIDYLFAACRYSFENHCRGKPFWFITAGFSDFTVGTLTRFYNSIVPYELPEEAEKREKAERWAKFRRELEEQEKNGTANRDGTNKIIPA